MVAEKPPGFHTHPTDLARHEVSFQEALEERLGVRLFTLHRLDRATSGLVLFARTPEAARFLQREFAQSRVEKTYLALLRGWVDAQTVRRPVWDDSRGKGYDAESHFEPLRRYRLPIPLAPYPEIRLTLVEVHPRTGRRHQIRLHARGIRHPIVGDTKHGDLKLNRAVAAALGISRLWLHARSLRFVHPLTLKPLALDSPRGLEEELERLRPYAWDGSGTVGPLTSG